MSASLPIQPREYRVLLEMINLATYVAQYHHRGGREDWLNAFDSLSDTILAMAGDMGCGDLVEQDPETGFLVPAEDYEEESFYKECVDDMIERCFWEELVARLTDRDLARSVGGPKWDAMSEAERTRRREGREQAWWKEFESNGIESLESINRTPNG